VALSGQPGSRTLTQEGVTLFNQTRYAEAKEALTRAVAADSKDAQAKAYLGLTLNNFDRDYDRAVDLLEAAVQIDPLNSRFHRWLGSVYGSKAGSTNLFKAPSFAKKCGAEMARAVELDPADLEAREALLQFCIQAPGFVGGGLDKARQQAAAMAKLDACRGLMAEAAIALHEKDKARAESLYRQAMAADPRRGAPYNGLAYLLLGDGKIDDALIVFRKYVQAVPADANAHDSLAEGLLAAGRAEDALAEYQRALSLDPWFSPSYLGAGRCYERTGNLQQARASYQRYLELVPKGRTAEEVRKRLADLHAGR
jgi:tetratricopeptide (TPR) repeat protein